MKSASAAAARRSRAACRATCPCSPRAARCWTSAAAAANSSPCCRRAGAVPWGWTCPTPCWRRRARAASHCLKADALEFLKARPDASLDGIFSSQVIEHFEPGYLRRAVAECFRALKPGAVLLLETINPLSLFALSRIYFLDPTHQRPLHPEYMRYLLENSGFAAVEILYGAEPEEEKLAAADPASPQALPFNGNVDRLNRLLFPSSEYAVKGVR